MIEHGVDTVVFIDILYPACGNTGILAYDIDIHISQQRHFCVESGLNDVIRIIPKISINGIGSNGDIVPIHTINHKFFTVDNQFLPFGSFFNRNLICLGKDPRAN